MNVIMVLMLMQINNNANYENLSSKLKNAFLLMCESMRAAKQNTFIIETNKSEHFLTVSKKGFYSVVRI